ncbi:sialate O-acetylesterase [Flagellimonas taeanensis]|uniref:Sialate O-acetylesterase n=2 Tax=Flagellimonas taeanensis TaxID=1005926 RepID=A0A1M7ANN1_9FLAO|nr:sialate O-acetylesterase [Allomuricauda taeanensis]SHL44354.1 sialate O-acetylesterase [Allomuricauda taeanensis]
MGRLRLVLYTVVCIWVSYQPTNAQVKLPELFSSNMVLQRNAQVAVWGWASANANIIINTSWMESPIEVKADNNGHWSIKLTTTNTKEPQSIEIKESGSSIILDNVLFGEVWLCSGQSNMEQSFKGYTGQPTFGALTALSNASNPNLRVFSVEHHGSKTPLDHLNGYRPWQEASPETIRDFSAIAYFFGQQLQEILDVPVGLVLTSWGGTEIQSWMAKDALEGYQPVDLEEVDINQNTKHIPTVLFNAMVNPLVPYTVKGMLWYQGESNRLEPQRYRQLLPAMIKDWRARWGQGDFPFYYVQVAPYLYDKRNDYFQEVENSAFIREAQLQSLADIPNSGMAVTMDIGESHTIHPPRKKEVADRLLYIALNQTYGQTAIDHLGPTYGSLTVKDEGIVLNFNNIDDTGLFAYGKLEGFEIAGEDRKFYPAEAKIVGNHKQVFVKSPKVPKPVAVRYAWRNWIIGTLYDVNLLPASSFRTDDWDYATRIEE